MQDVSPGKRLSAPLTLHRNIVLVMAGSEQDILYLRYSGSKRTEFLTAKNSSAPQDKSPDKKYDIEGTHEQSLVWKNLQGVTMYRYPTTSQRTRVMDKAKSVYTLDDPDDSSMMYMSCAELKKSGSFYLATTGEVVKFAKNNISKTKMDTKKQAKAYSKASRGKETYPKSKNSKGNKRNAVEIDDILADLTHISVFART